MDSFVKVKKSRHVLAKNSSFGTATTAKSTIATSKAEDKTTAPAVLKIMPKTTSVTPSESLKNQPCASTIPSEMSPETEPTESLAVLEKAPERKPSLQGENQLCESAFSPKNFPKAETSSASKDFHKLELAMPSEDQSHKSHRASMKFAEAVSGDSPVLKKSSRRKLTMPDPVQESDDESSPKKMLKTGSCGSQKFSSIHNAKKKSELNECSISTPRCLQSKSPKNERPSPSSKMCPEQKPSENQSLKLSASPTESFEEPAALKKSPKRKLAMPEENEEPYILTLLDCKPSPRDVKISPNVISPRSRDLFKISPSDFNSSPRSSNSSPRSPKMSPRNVINTSPRNFITSPKSSPKSPKSRDLFNLDFNTSSRNSHTKPICSKTTSPRKQSPSYVESSPAVENAAPDVSATFKRPLLKPRRSRKFRKEKVCYRTRSCPPSSNKTSLLTASETSDDHPSALPLGFKISSQKRELRDERSRGILAREITKQDGKNVLHLQSSTKSDVRRRESKMAMQTNSLSFVLGRSFKGPGFDMSDKKQDSSDWAHMASFGKNTLRLPAAKDDVGFTLSSDLLENMYGSLNTSKNQQGEDAQVNQQSLDLPLPLQELLRFPSVDNLPRHSSRMFGAPDLILMSQQGKRKGKGKGKLRLDYSEDKENVDPIFYPDLGLPLHGNTDT